MDTVKRTSIMFSTFISIFGLIAIFALASATTMQDHDTLRNGYKFHSAVPSDHNSPWISGPGGKRYQFHIGQQSWLSARESCLAQDSDLVTISSQQELDWILDHYKPQFNQMRERQIQIGLLMDPTEGGQKEWRWVDRAPANDQILRWTSGEPFDHAAGRERCALLNVNERRMDDVDCDLGGSPDHFYRFICERSGENHIKHEQLNNPLLKKLEEILLFFGVSAPATTVNKKDDDEYWDAADTNASSTAAAHSSISQPTAQPQTTAAENDANKSEETENSNSAQTKLQQEHSQNAQPELELAKDSLSPQNQQTHEADAKTAEVEKAQPAESEPQQAKDSETESSSAAEISVPSLTESYSTSATEATQHTESVERSAQKEKSEDESNSNAVDSAAKQNSETEAADPIVTLLAKQSASDVESSNITAAAAAAAADANSAAADADNTENAPEPIISRDAAIESASVETTRTTRADPLERLADTLERSIQSSNDATVAVATNEKTANHSSGKGKAMQNRIHSLERIITVVQKMIENPEMIAANPPSTKDNNTVDDNTVDEKGTITVNLPRSSVGDVAHRSLDYNSTNDKNENLGLKITAGGDDDDDESGANVDAAFNLEDDFVHAHAETRAHPKINSGDLVIRSDADVIGACGGAPSEGDKKKAAKKAADESDETSEETDENTATLQKILRKFRKYLKSDEAKDVKRILEDKSASNKTMLERLEEAAKLTEKDLKDSQKKSERKPIVKSAVNGKDDSENPIQALIKLYERKFNGEKQAKIDAQLFAELDRLREVESQEGEFGDDSRESEEDEIPNRSRGSNESKSAEDGSSEEVKNSDARPNANLPPSANSASAKMQEKEEIRPTTAESDKEESDIDAVDDESVEEKNNSGKSLLQESESLVPEGKKISRADAEPLSLNSAGNNSLTNLPEIENSKEKFDSEANDSISHNPTEDIINAMFHNPTQELIEAVLKVQDKIQSEAKLADESKHNVTEASTELTTKAAGLREKSQKKEKVAQEKPQNNHHQSAIETDDPTSVFPRPNFNLLKAAEFESLPEAIEARARAQAEKKEVDAAYDSFKQHAGDTDALIRRIQAADAQRQSPAVRQAKTAPFLIGKDVQNIEKFIETTADLVA